jgi:hypothetical protein
MSEVVIESDEGELFGENLTASFVCDVDYTYVPYEPETEYSPEEGGYTQVDGFTFKMTVESENGKNNLLGSFVRYEDLSEEKQKEITQWVSKYIDSYFENQDKSDYCQDYDDSERYSERYYDY